MSLRDRSSVSPQTQQERAASFFKTQHIGETISGLSFSPLFSGALLANSVYLVYSMVLSVN